MSESELDTEVPFVVLGSACWETPTPVNCHQIARRLAERGHRVLFVESTGLRAPAILGSGHDRRRALRRLLGGWRAPQRIAAGLDVAAPITLPAGWPEPLRSLSLSGLAHSVRRAARAVGLERPIAWAFLPTQLAAARALSPRLLVYHAVDDYAANPGVDARWIRRLEEKMLDAADLVFAASPSLAERLRLRRPDTELLANVADVALFSAAHAESIPEPAALRGLARPRAVYVGNLAAYRVDFELLRAVARALPTVEILLVGPIGLGDPSAPSSATRTLALEPNVRFFGAVAQEELPAFLAHCDVALLPLLDNDHTRACLPLKLWEYLAAGLPVVARDLPNLHEVAPDPPLRLARDPVEFAAALEKSLLDPPGSRARRLGLARPHDWAIRMSEVTRRLARALAQTRTVSSKPPG